MKKTFLSRSVKRALYTVATVLSVLAIAAQTQVLAFSPTINEYQVPGTAPIPLYIASGPDGNLWFVNNNTNEVAKITTGGTITTYTIPTSSSDSRVITAGPDGNLWFTELGANKIGKVTTGGSFTEYNVPTSSAEPQDIKAGPDGNLWFTEPGVNKIGRITTAGVITEFAVTTQPYYLTVGTDGNIWYTAPNNNTVSKINTSGSGIVNYTVPTASSANVGIATGGDGNVWFTERNGNKIAKITPSGTITEYNIPTASSTTIGITQGSDGKMWFAEYDGNKIASITYSGVITEYNVPTANAQPNELTSGPDGNIWFTESSGFVNKIGQLVLPPKPAVSNKTVGAVTGKATTVNVVSGVANNPDPSTLSIVSGPSHGTASVNTTSGTITYTSASGYVGNDSLTYQICSADDSGICAQATLTFVVSATGTVGAPNTGFGVFTTNPLRTLVASAALSLVLFVSAFVLSRRFARR